MFINHVVNDVTKIFNINKFTQLAKKLFFIFSKPHQGSTQNQSEQIFTGIYVSSTFYAPPCKNDNKLLALLYTAPLQPDICACVYFARNFIIIKFNSRLILQRPRPFNEF